MSKVRNCAARTALDSSPPLFVEDHKVVVRFRRSFGGSSLPLPLCWLQLSRIRRLLKTAAPFPYRRGAGALSGIDSRRVRSREVTIVNLQFPNFKLGCVSCWNWCKGMLTAALDHRSAMTRPRDLPQRVRRRIRLPGRK